MPSAVRRHAELLLSSGGLKAPAKSSETTAAIRRQDPQSDASTHGGNELPWLASWKLTGRCLQCEVSVAAPNRPSSPPNHN